MAARERERERERIVKDFQYKQLTITATVIGDGDPTLSSD